MTPEAILAAWDLGPATVTLAARRENTVWRVEAGAAFALRLHRPGYHSAAALASELAFMAAMADAGLTVPRPVPARDGALLVAAGETHADLLTWLPGAPFGRAWSPLDLADPPGAFRMLGAALARLHLAADAWAPPPGFTRPDWGAEGLVGEAPFWGRFWDHPALTPDQRRAVLRVRDQGREALPGLGLDHGLIHADAVRENLLLDGERLALIDFDDCGWGYRLFDIATALLPNRGEPGYPALKAALLDGYRAHRPLDIAALPLLVRLRALTYLGWVLDRAGEPGMADRAARVIARAMAVIEEEDP
jgi:Ser/Thr protein kinase RdoA (MazF antagonist)